MNMQYYEHTCLCGCNGKIEIKRWHKYDGIPKYINGHNKTKGSLIHGETNTRLYRIWNGIKNRCLNLKHKSYKDYGGRGITICPEWTNDYIKFRDWVLNNGYADNLTIDRIDNNGNYEPNNCQWLIKKENIRKRRTTKLSLKRANEVRALYKTKEYSQHRLAKKFSISQTVICDIINNKIWKNY